MRALASSAWQSILRHSGSLRVVFAGQFLSAIGMAVTSRVVTEIVRPDALGEYKLAAGAVGFGTALGVRPFLQFFMREFHDARRDKLAPEFLEYAQRELVLLWGIVALILAVILCLWNPPELHFLAAVILLCGLLVLLHGQINFRTSLLITKNSQRGASTLRAALQVGIPLGTAVGALIGGQTGVALLTGEAVFLGALVGFLWNRDRAHSVTVCRPSALQVTAWRHAAVKFSVPLLMVGLSSWVLSVSDRFILSAHATTSAIGAYSAVYGLASQPLLILSGMGAQVVYPLIFKAAAEKGAAGSKAVLGRNVLISWSAAITAFVLYLLFGWLVIRLLLAAPYRTGALPILWWVAAGYAMLAMAAPFELRSYAEKTTSQINIAYATAAVANLCLNFLWIPSQGALGAAKATFFGFLVYLVVLLGIHFFRQPAALQAPAA